MAQHFASQFLPSDLRPHIKAENYAKYRQTLFRPPDIFDEEGWKEANEATKVFREKVKGIG